MGISQGQTFEGTPGPAAGYPQAPQSSPPVLQHDQQQAYLPPQQQGYSQQQGQQNLNEQGPPGQKGPAQYSPQPAIGVPQPGAGSALHAQVSCCNLLRMLLCWKQSLCSFVESGRCCIEKFAKLGAHKQTCVAEVFAI